MRVLTVLLPPLTASSKTVNIDFFVTSNTICCIIKTLHINDWSYLRRGLLIRARNTNST